MERAGPTVLVIDDDDQICGLVCRVLSQAGLSAEVASTGAAGLARVEAGGIDLVLLDLRLPDLDGFSVCRQLRALEFETYLPIIMLTGVADGGQRHAGFQAGADDYITKPFDLRDLLDRVEVWLGVRGRLKALHEQLLRDAVYATARALQDDLSAWRDQVVVALHRWEARSTSAEGSAALVAELEDATSGLVTSVERLTRAVEYYSTLPRRAPD